MHNDKLAREGLRVLIVDDEPDLRHILAEVLGALGGYEVYTASDAKSALLLVDQQDKPFDGVFLDIQMPGMSGTQLCEVLRSTPGYADVPILMLTAMTDREYLQKAFIAGANDLISKPFDFNDLKDRFAGERFNRFRRGSLKENAGLEGLGVATGSREVIRSLQDAIAISGVPRCIKKEAFEIYLRQSLKRYSAPIWIRAIKIGRVYDLFTRIQERQFQKVVHDVARAFSKATQDSEDIFTYAGNGVFLSSCVTESAFTTPFFIDTLRRQESVRDLERHDMRLAVFLGNQVSVDGRTASDVMVLLNRSIESAERAENSHFGWNSYREWLSRRNSTGNEQPNNEKAHYQHILKEFIREGHLGWRR
jgi:CheY-like chemotaxis protein